MEFSFSAQRWLTDWEIATGEEIDTSFALGLHVPGRFDKVLDLRACYLQSEWSARLVNGVRQFAREHDWNPWHAREHTGFLRILGVPHAGAQPRTRWSTWSPRAGTTSGWRRSPSSSSATSPRSRPS